MNELSLLRGKDLVLGPNINAKHFKLKDIEEIDCDKYNMYLSMMIMSVLDVADILWCKNKIWYEDIKDWDFFIQRALSGNNFRNIFVEKNKKIIGIEEDCLFVNEEYKKVLNLFLGWNYDYIALNIKSESGNQTVLTTVKKIEEKNIYIISDDTIKFTEHYYKILVSFLKEINWIKNDYVFLKGGNKYAKKYILENNYKERKYKKKEVINLNSIVSSLIAKGQSYSEIWNYPIYTVYDLYYRLVKITEYNNTMQAYLDGCIDTKSSPIKWDEINWASIIKK